MKEQKLIVDNKLIGAVERNDPKEARTMILCGADVNANDGKTLSVATHHGNADMIKKHKEKINKDNNYSYNGREKRLEIILGWFEAEINDNQSKGRSRRKHEIVRRIIEQEDRYIEQLYEDRIKKMKEDFKETIKKVENSARYQNNFFWIIGIVIMALGWMSSIK